MLILLIWPNSTINLVILPNCSAWNPQDFGFLDPDLQKYADPQIRIQEAKYQPKVALKKIILKPKSELLKRFELFKF